MANEGQEKKQTILNKDVAKRKKKRRKELCARAENDNVPGLQLMLVGEIPNRCG